jgi:hypothetical protein
VSRLITAASSSPASLRRLAIGIKQPGLPGSNGQPAPVRRVSEHQKLLLACQVVTPPRRPDLRAGQDLLAAGSGCQQQSRQRTGGICRPPGFTHLQR